MRALFFDGGGDLGGGVGDYVEGVHVDEDDGELDGDEFSWRGEWLGLEGGKWDLRMGAANNY